MYVILHFDVLNSTKHSPIHMMSLKDFNREMSFTKNVFSWAAVLIDSKSSMNGILQFLAFSPYEEFVCSHLSAGLLRCAHVNTVKLYDSYTNGYLTQKENKLGRVDSGLGTNIENIGSGTNPFVGIFLFHEIFFY